MFKRPIRLLAAVLGLIATQAIAQADLGEHLAACAACHGAHGEGVRGAEYYPHLAGKPSGYLFEQLKGFRDGRRLNTQMTWLVQFVDDRYLHEIADYYAALSPRTRAADSATAGMTEERRKVAENLVEHGDPARGVPACSECHGKNLSGLDPGVPALVGLPVDYIIAQFGSWHEGIRRGAPPDCMHDVAERIAPEDIRAIAIWLSQQSNADGERPAPAGSFVPPKACGSLPHAEKAP